MAGAEATGPGGSPDRDGSPSTGDARDEPARPPRRRESRPVSVAEDDPPAGVAGTARRGGSMLEAPGPAGSVRAELEHWENLEHHDADVAALRGMRSAADPIIAGHLASCREHGLVTPWLDALADALARSPEGWALCRAAAGPAASGPGWPPAACSGPGYRAEV